MTRQNKIKKTYHLEADIVLMVEEMRKHYVCNYNQLINNILRNAYKQMQNDVSFANTQDIKTVLDYFKERLDNRDKEVLEFKKTIDELIEKNKHLEDCLDKNTEKLNKAVNAINQHRNDIDNNKKISDGLRKDVDEIKNKKIFGFSKG